MVISIGLIFHAFVTAVISIVAFILVYELFSRHLNHMMVSYGLFWLFTGLLWAQNAYRNAMIGFGVEDFPRFASAVMSQTTVFISGIPLYYYIGRKVFKSPLVAKILTTVAVIVGIVGSWFLAQPNGIIFEPITFFTAEAVANPISAVLFRVSIGAIIVALVYSFAVEFKTWRGGGVKAKAAGYEILYDIAIFLYVFFGVIDLAKLVTDWHLVIFRILYCAAFLMVYLSVRHQRESSTDYLFVKYEKL
ncbi:hypothetical protein COV04_02480 [Candidatus Uhrbacteria bacterium CG10_big_fil_rev_8_21_14_0_10_48_11]|uniref:Histidine kinase N-terminal 7TM region domain-containing protein n=1 Tax=Candidatus Uhrbacteria bacterium CG10_big_fil_rev_8_21_14_0_10_48_11 TaxID=1975037 RepID=A0A2M8LEI0_9BACT|nr:MAG: hypothetical protein COV04_02480 [Candidatus Uhrbacteria bacterium CG10_big_fil_rev_8_21_14_0_10_48_11]